MVHHLTSWVVSTLVIIDRVWRSPINADQRLTGRPKPQHIEVGQVVVGSMGDDVLTITVRMMMGGRRRRLGGHRARGRLGGGREFLADSTEERGRSPVISRSDGAGFEARWQQRVGSSQRCATIGRRANAAEFVALGAHQFVQLMEWW